MKYLAKVSIARFGAPAQILAIQLFFLMTFGLAALEKWMGGVPEWFTKQFGTSLLAHGPGGLTCAYYFIAMVETFAFLGFAVSFFRLECVAHHSKMFLRLSLSLALFIFVMLAFGQRLTSKYGEAVQLFIYFTGTLIALQVTEREDTLL